jgi:EmrB/QacA subfamily drug resistance transporter
MQGVVASYALAVAMLIPASGWLADRFGTRRVFIAAVVLFSVGSLACALSRGVTQLVASRVLQGIGGSMLLPVGRLVVMRVIPREDFLAAMSFVTIPGLIGPLIGPTLGGWLVQIASWHWIFLINLPLGVAGGIAALRVMPDLRQPVGRFDALGYALFAYAMVAVSLALDALSTEQPRHAAVVILTVSGLASLVAYWLHAARAERPLFSLALFKVDTFRVGILGNLFSRVGSGAMPYLIPLLMQVALGYSALHAGMMMIPAALAGMFSKRVVVPLVHRFGYRRVLVGNTLLVGTTMASFALLRPGLPVWVHAVQFAAFGAVNSLQFTAMNTLTLRDLDGEFASSGNGLLSMLMMLTVSLGVAMAGGLLGAFGGVAAAVPSQLDTLTAFRWTFVCVGVVTVTSAAIFAQLEPTHSLQQATVQETEAQ